MLDGTVPQQPSKCIVRSFVTSAAFPLAKNSEGARGWKESSVREYRVTRKSSPMLKKKREEAEPSSEQLPGAIGLHGFAMEVTRAGERCRSLHPTTYLRTEYSPPLTLLCKYSHWQSRARNAQAEPPPSEEHEHWHSSE